MMVTSRLSTGFFDKISKFALEPVHIAPLIVLRIIFGAIMFISILRFILKGWVYELYIAPKFYFPFFGFEWVKPLGAAGMYILFGVLLISTLLITIGLFYKVAISSFFLCFTYVELIDKTNYLNHYYFVSIVSFLLILVPAQRYFSIDVKRDPSILTSHVPRWQILLFQLQLAIVYFYAGLAKLNYDWLVNAMPLKIWLPANAHLPVIGSLLDKVWVAYFFSWFGAIYDLSIPFLLFLRKTRFIAYFLVVVFHLSTALLFQIGMFPYIMILITLIFFSETFHLKILKGLGTVCGAKNHPKKPIIFEGSAYSLRLITFVLIVHFTVQLAFPFRHLIYQDNLFWTEQGYRFSWRVMLMEKAGSAFFYVGDPETGRKEEVSNLKYLTKNQEKMMSTQPDMILQFAHFLEEEYQKKGIKNPIVTVKSYVTLNGKGSKLFIDTQTDLTELKDGFSSKSWILPYQDMKSYDAQ